MKLLIIGIDGGDQRIIDAMPMPYLQSLLHDGANYSLKEDLFERGWAKILCGEPGWRTGALYAKPDFVPGGCGATASWKSDDYAKVGVKPLWQALNERGLSVGFMNVPTTYPAPTVNGFFVAGAGGGIGDGVMPPAAVYPEGVAQALTDVDYIFDTRYAASGIKELHNLLERLRSMTERRIAAYSRLAEQYTPDVGFVAFMGPRSLQYLAMQEIESIIAGRASSNALTYDQREIEKFYAHFDDNIKELVNNVSPDAVVLTSDHGQAPHKFDVDVGALLRTAGKQSLRNKGVRSLQSNIRSTAKFLLPKPLAKRFSKKSFVRQVAGAQTAIDFSDTVAFGLRNVPGVYINDERFAGKVQSASADHRDLVQFIINQINDCEEAQRHGIKAYQYTERDSAPEQVRALLPDIWMDLPEGYLVDYGVGNSTTHLDSLVSDNPAWGKPMDYAEAHRDQWTGMKGKTPLLTITGAVGGFTSVRRSGDLTDAYHLVLSVVGGN